MDRHTNLYLTHILLSTPKQSNVLLQLPLSLATTILASNNVPWAEEILTKSDSLLQLLLGRREQWAFRIGYIQHQHNSETKEKK